MNCRRLAVVAVAFIGLVPATQAASAKPTSHHSATATATILQSFRVKDVTGEGGSSRPRGASQSALRRFIDQDGFVTTAENPQARVIFIVDLP
jgi:hypothetical protein